MCIVCLGHEHALITQNEVGDLEFEWMRTYGLTWRIRGQFGASPVMLESAIAFEAD